jgi:hypothetical protein
MLLESLQELLEHRIQLRRWLVPSHDRITEPQQTLLRGKSQLEDIFGKLSPWQCQQGLSAPRYKVPGTQNLSLRYPGFHKGLDTTPAQIPEGVVQRA